MFRYANYGRWRMPNEVVSVFSLANSLVVDVM